MPQGRNHLVSLVRSGDFRGERPPDRAIPTQGGKTMAELREYEVTIGGNKTTIQLTEEDAKAYEDAKLVESKAVAEAPKNKARSAPNKGA